MFRGINLRLRGDNVIRNNGDDRTPGNADDGFSLDLFHSVDFRQDGGHTTFIGPMEFGNLTNASLRDPEIKGGIDVFGGARVEVRKSSTGSNELTGGGNITVSGDSQLNFSRPNISVDVGSIEVNEFSSLNLSNNVSVTTAGDVNMGRSVLTMASNSSMNVGGNFGAFNRVDIGIFGDGANLNVAGDLIGNSFFNMNLGENVSLKVDGKIIMADFTLLFGGNDVSITGDMRFGSKDGKVNLFGDRVHYIGNIEFSPDSDLNFGADAEIFGNIEFSPGGNLNFGADAKIFGGIDCGGGDVSFEGAFMVFGGFANCNSFPP